MKLVLLFVMLISAQFVQAQRRMTTAEARTRVERSATYREIEAARSAGRDIARDAQLMVKVNRMLDVTLRDVVTLSAGDRTKLVKLINVSSLDVLAEVARLSSVAKDASASAGEKANARKALQLMVKAGHNVASLVRNSAEARAQQALVTKIIEISEKISNLNFGASSRDFAQRYERALTEGKTVDEAIRIASNGKFTERDLRECT